MSPDLKPTVLILCTGNSCRSHMAEGILRAKAGNLVNVQSAGSNPAGYVHPLAIKVMAEIGMDISTHRSKHLNEFLAQAIHTVITVCGNADQVCPVFPGRANRHHWPFDDPAQATGTEAEVLACFRRVRDELRRVFEAYADGLRDVLVSFIYTGCLQVCPTPTRTLKRAVESAQRALGPDSFHVLSVGFNQPFDTPEAMGAFACQQNVDLPSWRFLSPDPRTLAGLAQDVGFMWRESGGGFDHITQVTVLDQAGRVYRQVYGDSFPLPQLVGPLKELLTGSPPPDESIAGLLERVRILCTVYDPVTGEYRFKRSLLLQVLSHSDTTDGGEATCNLRNRNNQFVASGVYFYHVETPTGQTKVGRFTVVNFAP